MWSWQFQQKPLAPADTHGIQPRLSMRNPMFPSPRMSSNLSSFCSWRKLSFVAWCDETCDETPSHQTIKPIKSSVLSMKSGYWCSGACNIYIWLLLIHIIYIYTHTCLSHQNSMPHCRISPSSKSCPREARACSHWHPRNMLDKVGQSGRKWVQESPGNERKWKTNERKIIEK